MIRVVHIITTLEAGGAELTLEKLISRMDPQRFQCRVICLGHPGEVGQAIETSGRWVASLGLERVSGAPGALVKLIRLLRSDPPDVVQTWMYHADLLGSVAAKIASAGLPVIWGLRHSDLLPGIDKRSTILAARINSSLSHFLPSRIVCGSLAAARAHEALGYAKEKFVSIPNGFEVPALQRPHREDVRREFGFDEQTIVVARIGRFHPQKDHETLVKAARVLLGKGHREVRFLLCGQGMVWENAQLRQWIGAESKSKFALAGFRKDIGRILQAADIAVSSSSSGEGFPNVVAEAMAAGVPAVATDVGDSAYLVGNAGRIVPPRNFAALAGAIGDLLDLSTKSRNELGLAGRRRIQERFSVQAMVSSYETLYGDVSARHATKYVPQSLDK